MEEEKIPKDLGLKILSKDKAFWTRVVENLKKENSVLEDSTRFNSKVLEMAEKELSNAE